MIEHLRDFWEEARENKIKAFVYISLRILVVIVLIAEIFNRNYNNVFLCVLTLILFMIPNFLNKRMNIVLPGTLEIIDRPGGVIEAGLRMVQQSYLCSGRTFCASAGE